MPCSIGQNLWKSARQHSSTLSFFLLVTGVLHLETRYISRLMIDSLIISSLFNNNNNYNPTPLPTPIFRFHLPLFSAKREWSRGSNRISFAPLSMQQTHKSCVRESLFDRLSSRVSTATDADGRYVLFLPFVFLGLYFTHLERNLSAHCPAVCDDGLHVRVLSIPTVELHAAASRQ